jgi:hypothetical protein
MKSSTVLTSEDSMAAPVHNRNGTRSGEGFFGRPSLPTLRGLPPGRAPVATDDDDECADEKSGVSLIASPRPRALRRANQRRYRKPAFEPFGGLSFGLSAADLDGRTVTEWPPQPRIESAANDTGAEEHDETASATVTEWPPPACEPAWSEVDVSDLDGATFVDSEPPCFVDAEPTPTAVDVPPHVLFAAPALSAQPFSPEPSKAATLCPSTQSSVLSEVARGMGYGLAIAAALVGVGGAVTALLM